MQSKLLSLIPIIKRPIWARCLLQLIPIAYTPFAPWPKHLIHPHQGLGVLAQLQEMFPRVQERMARRYHDTQAIKTLVWDTRDALTRDAIAACEQQDAELLEQKNANLQRRADSDEDDDVIDTSVALTGDSQLL